jgi:hypothetical protein
VPWPRIAGWYGISALHGLRLQQRRWLSVLEDRQAGLAKEIGVGDPRHSRLVELTRLITLENLRGRFNLALGTGASASALASTVGGPVTRRRGHPPEEPWPAQPLEVSSQREPERARQAVAVIGGSAGIGLGGGPARPGWGAGVIFTGRNPDRLQHAAAEIGPADRGLRRGRPGRPRPVLPGLAVPRLGTAEGASAIQGRSPQPGPACRLITTSRKSKPSDGRVVEAGQDTDAVAARMRTSIPLAWNTPVAGSRTSTPKGLPAGCW